MNPIALISPTSNCAPLAHKARPLRVSPNFWPNATLQALISLPSVLDANYTREAPAPYTLRTISGGRKAGALQSAP